MPKLTAGSTEAVRVRPGAKGYRLIGLDIANNQAAAGVLLRLGINDSTQTTTAQIPSHIIIDRCYIHGQALPNKTSVGISADADYVAVINSYVTEIHDGSGDDQAILSINANGPFIFRNNYLEAAGENTMFGGGDPNIPHANPCDATIEGNWYFKDPAKWSNSVYAVKNLFELKTGCRLKIQGNTFQNHKSGVQSQYFPIVMKTANQGATCKIDNGYYNQVADITFAYNRIINVPQGFAIGRVAACDINQFGSTTFYIHDNLITGLGSGHTQDGAPKLLQWSYPKQEAGGEIVYPRNVTFSHNTIGTITKFGIDAYRYQHLETQGNYVHDHNFHSNIVVGKWFVSGTYNNATSINQRYLAQFTAKNNLSISSVGTVFPAAPNYSQANFNNLFINAAGGDFRLTPAATSAYPGADGYPVGANIGTLDACTAGSTTGTWTVGSCPGGTVVPPPTVSLTANGATTPITVPPGSNVVLQWTVSGATGCEANASNPYGATIWHGSKSFSAGTHSETINPAQSATYSIGCTHASGQATASAVVNVSQVCAQPPL